MRCRLLLLKHKEEGNVVTFFAATLVEKKAMAISCRHLLFLLKHKEESVGIEKDRRGR